MTEKLWAPYGPPSTTLAVIRHYRNRDVPDRLTTTELLQLGVGEALINRVWASLKFLGLVEENGTTTDSFRAIRRANDEKYQTVFRGVLEATYSNIFGFLDPATATDQQLRNAFHPYSPGAQRGRMITFFLGLCREAGIELTTPLKQSTVRGAVRSDDKSKAPSPTRVQRSSPAVRSDKDAALIAWVETRPPVEQGWSIEDRERWLVTLRAIIDGIYDAVPMRVLESVGESTSSKE